MTESSPKAKSKNSGPGHTLDMRSEGYSEECIAQSLEFIRACIRHTPLRRYSRLFRLDEVGVTGAMAGSLVEGFEQFRTDLARWSLSFESPKDLFDYLLLAPSLQATYFYRTCRALHLREVQFAPNVLATISRLLTGIEIYYSADIGPGLKVIHGIGTVIGAGCKIGSRFTVYQGVTIGDSLGSDTGKRPVIGNDVIASAGSQVLGAVSVGSKTIIASNAVVIHSLPDRCIAAGVPAEVKVADLPEARFHEFQNAIKG